MTDGLNDGFGKYVDVNYHSMTNQAVYDLAQALGNTEVGLASFHKRIERVTSIEFCRL